MLTTHLQVTQAVLRYAGRQFYKNIILNGGQKMLSPAGGNLMINEKTSRRMSCAAYGSVTVHATYVDEAPHKTYAKDIVAILRHFVYESYQ